MNRRTEHRELITTLRKPCVNRVAEDDQEKKNQKRFKEKEQRKWNKEQDRMKKRKSFTQPHPSIHACSSSHPDIKKGKLKQARC